MAMPSRSSATTELRLVLLGKVGAGKSEVVRLLLGEKEPRGASGLCVLHKGESAGRRICLVETPGWAGSSTQSTSKNVGDEIVRSVTLCPPGPHALIVLFRVESTSDVLSELKTASRHLELLSQRVWKHTMVVFLCDEGVEKTFVTDLIEEDKILQKCGNRHYILHSETQIPEFLEEIEMMVKHNCEDFLLPQVYYDYFEKSIPEDVAVLKKLYEDREEQLRQGYQTRINEYKRRAEEAETRQRRGSFSGVRPNMSEEDQSMDIVAIKTKYRDEMLALARYYLKPVALIALVFIGALVGSVVGSAYGVTGSGVGIVIGVAITIPLALWLIGAASLARDSSRILQERSAFCEQTVTKREQDLDCKPKKM